MDFLWQHMDKVVSALVGLTIFVLARYAPKLFTRLRSANVNVDPVRALFTVAGICGLSFVGLQGYALHKHLKKKALFDDYIVAAYKAEDAKTAKKQFRRAMVWIEENGAKEGFTSVSYQSPTDNVNDWYENVANVDDEMDRLVITKDTPQPWRQSMVHHRLVLVDGDGKVTSVQTPRGLYLHPNNRFFGWSTAVALVGSLTFLTLGGITLRKRMVRKADEEYAAAGHSA